MTTATPAVNGAAKDFSAALRWTVLVTALSTVAYGVVVVLVGGDSVASALAMVSAQDVFLVLALVSSGYIWRCVRWAYFSNVLGHHLPVFRHVLYYVAGLAFSATPAKAGEALRSVYLRSHGIPYAHAVGMTVAERLLDVIVMGLMAVSLLSWFSVDPQLIAIACGLVIAAVLMLSGRALDRATSWLEERLSPGKMRTLAVGALNAVRTAGQLVNRRYLAVGLGFGALTWCTEAYAFWLLAGGFGISLSALLACGIYAGSILIGVASFLPGGVGGTEAAMTLMLTSIGNEMGTVVSFILVFRVLTLWFAVVLGFIAMVVIRLVDDRWQPA